MLQPKIAGQDGARTNSNKIKKVKEREIKAVIISRKLPAQTWEVGNRKPPNWSTEANYIPYSDTWVCPSKEGVSTFSKQCHKAEGFSKL